MAKQAKQILASGKHLRLVTIGGWECVERLNVTGIVAVVGVTDAGAVLLVEQYRPPLGKRVIELPAGLVGDVPGSEGEALMTAAQRELLEETGYEASEFEVLTEGPPSAGLSSEMITFLRARGLRRVGPGGGDGHEDIRIHEVPLDGIDEWLERKSGEGLVLDPKVYTGLYFLLRARQAGR